MARPHTTDLISEAPLKRRQFSGKVTQAIRQSCMHAHVFSLSADSEAQFVR